MREDYIYYNLSILLNSMIRQVEENTGVLYPLEYFLPNTDWHQDVGALKFNTMVKYFTQQGYLQEGLIPELSLDADWNYSITREYIRRFLESIDFNVDFDKDLAFLNGSGQYWGFSSPLSFEKDDSIVLTFKTEATLWDKYFLDGRDQGTGLYLVINSSGGWDWSEEVQAVYLDNQPVEKYENFSLNDNQFHKLKVVFSAPCSLSAVGVSQWNSNWFEGVFSKVVKMTRTEEAVYSNDLVHRDQGAIQLPEVGTQTLIMAEYNHEVWGYSLLDFGYKTSELSGSGGYGSSDAWSISDGASPSNNIASEGTRFIAQEGDLFLKYVLGSLLTATDVSEDKEPIAQLGLYKNNAEKELVHTLEFRGEKVEGYMWNEVPVDSPIELEAGQEYFLALAVNGWTDWPEFSPEDGVSDVYSLAETQVLTNLEGLSNRPSNWAIPFYAIVERKINTEE